MSPLAVFNEFATRGTPDPDVDRWRNAFPQAAEPTPQDSPDPIHDIA